jgi:hypothetical protein
MSTFFLFQSILMTIQCVKAVCVIREELLVLQSVDNTSTKAQEKEKDTLY